jgi:predicted RNase H-like HicB family nuclease
LSFSSYPVIEKSPVGIFDETLNKLPFSYGQVRLNRPIIVETYLSGRFFIISNQRFNVHAYGQTLKEARTNFFESFEELHDLYISSDKDELTGDAIELKELFDNLIKK